MLVHVFTFLDAAVQAKPSMWANERLQPLHDWHDNVSAHPDQFLQLGPQDDVSMALEPEESNLIKGAVSRLWDGQQAVNFKMA